MVRKNKAQCLKNKNESWNPGKLEREDHCRELVDGLPVCDRWKIHKDKEDSAAVLFRNKVKWNLDQQAIFRWFRSRHWQRARISQILWHTKQVKSKLWTVDVSHFAVEKVL